MCNIYIVVLFNKFLKQIICLRGCTFFIYIIYNIYITDIKTKILRCLCGWEKRRIYFITPMAFCVSSLPNGVINGSFSSGSPCSPLCFASVPAPPGQLPASLWSGNLLAPYRTSEASVGGVGCGRTSGVFEIVLAGGGGGAMPI